MSQIDIESTDLNLLKVFEAIYDEGGAGRAALRLGVTQSAVSASLARLRTLYADPLFVRTGRGLSPSLRARELRPIIGEALDKCRQSLSLARPGPAGLPGVRSRWGCRTTSKSRWGARPSRRWPRLRRDYV